MGKHNDAGNGVLPLSLLAVALLTAAPATYSAELVFFDFDEAGSFSIEPERSATGITVALFGIADGTLTGFSGNPGSAAGGRSWDDGNAFVLDLDVLIAATLNGISFDQRASSSGPAAWEVLVNDIQIASGATTTAFTSVNVPLADLPIGPGPLLLAVSGMGAASSGGTWRIDNLSLTGT
ncbi:MAG: hypothetical protein HKO62_11825, partial [Gammaproteobacteria bacterium]|nr:hypothetical protein [Gammaproteobacteria bacterium]